MPSPPSRASARAVSWPGRPQPRPGTFLVLAVVAATPLPVHAVPALELLLTGDAAGLAQGGIDPFRHPELDARSLLHPAALATTLQPQAWSSVEQQDILHIRGSDAFAGSDAGDLSLAAGAQSALWQYGDWHLGAGVRALQRQANTVVHSEADGDLLRLDQRSLGAAVALGAAYDRFAMGATVDTTGPHAGHTLELTVQPLRTLAIGLRHLHQEDPMDVTAPSGLAPHSVTTPITTRLHTATNAEELSAQLSGELASLSAAAATSGDRFLEARTRFRQWTLAWCWTRNVTGSSDWAQAAGANIGQVDVSTVTTRSVVQLHGELGNTELRATVGSATFAHRGGLRGNGPATAQVLLHLDFNLGLFANNAFDITVNQAAAGIAHRFGALEILGGIQLAQATAGPSGLSYGAHATGDLNGSSNVQSAEATLLGLTAGARVQWFGMNIVVGAAQLLPLAFDARGTIANPEVAGGARTNFGGSAGAGQATARGNFLDGIAGRVNDFGRVLGTYGGGRLVSVEITRRF